MHFETEVAASDFFNIRLQINAMTQTQDGEGRSANERLKDMLAKN